MFLRDEPRLFGLPPGADFPRELLIGLEQRLKSCAPDAWARVEIFVNTRRMQRRLVDIFNQGPPRLLPRIRLVTELHLVAGLSDIPAPIPPLRRRLELSQLVAGLLRAQPDLAPSAALFDLSDSLAALMDEMQGEGVTPDVLRNLDLSHLSAHWERTRSFLSIIEAFFDGQSPDPEARQRLAAQRLAQIWQDQPPDHPIIVAGSTGSRGATALFMQAVARLPLGAVVLPGFDFDQPAAVWDGLDDALTAEDHPQYRFRKLADALALHPSDIRLWHSGAAAPVPSRNKLVSLALRPAPVTDQWLEEGPSLGDLLSATQDLTLVEAPSPRAEALAIALRLRQAIEDGHRAALITPDRVLTRQVTAALDRWGILPDDSAGQPLHLSAPGRLLRQIAALFGQKLTSETLLALLKHPLTFSTVRRGHHLRWTRDLELFLRRHGIPFPTDTILTRWAERQNDDGRREWASWLGKTLAGTDMVGTRDLKQHITHLWRLADALAAGDEEGRAGQIWDEPAGISARQVMQDLLDESGAAGQLTPSDFSALFTSVLSARVVQNPARSHPDVMIWGTLEARMQGADLVILGGLNEGSWPATPAPDPWLNREMRKQAGLLLPERRIGLSAHDFQQAIGVGHVVLTRAIRNDEAETVPSRWLNRLMNLLSGLPRQAGDKALDEMRGRGKDLLAMAVALDQPDISLPPAPRPAPRPPVAARPRQLSVTRITVLIRDPYAIYAAYILNLRPLDPLQQVADAPLRGTILHKILDQFIRQGVNADPAKAKRDLLQIADSVFAEDAPWIAAQRIWRARLARVADWLIAGEHQRMLQGTWVALEQRGSVALENGFVLTAEADRIDRLNNGHLIIYDYKTGTPPSPRQMTEFDKQLLLEAAMAERGGFAGLDPAPVDRVAYIGLGSAPKIVTHDMADGLADTTWAELVKLITQYGRRDQGYLSRRAVFSRDSVGDYDHLARFGEWDSSTPGSGQEVG